MTNLWQNWDNTEDDHRPGRPKTLTIDEQVDGILWMNLDDMSYCQADS